MKNILFTWLAMLMVSPAFGSTVRDFKFSELTRLTPNELENFNSSLAHTLNTLQRCPEKDRSAFNFGNTLHSLHFSSNRNGNESIRIEASGQRPPPSISKFDVTITIESKIVPHTGPIPADGGSPRAYVCKTEYK